MYSESDLTESDEEVPLASQSKSTKDKKEAGYRIRGALKAPRATSYTTQALYDQIYGDDVDLDADYQRDVVWPDHKQIGLIDSIFRNFYVPPVIFAVKYLDDGSEKRVCIDGKQRLTSIYRFMDGLIPYRDIYTNEKFVYKKTNGNDKMKAKLLPERYRKIFATKQIVCMEYQDLTNDNEREIFQRVQLGMALTPAEKLQAVNSPVAAFIRELQHSYVVEGLDKLDWDISRGGDFRGLASAVFQIERWPAHTMAGHAQVQKWLQQPDELDEDFCESIRDTFSIFLALTKDKKLNKVFRLEGVKKVSPAEILAISMLIHVHKHKFTLAQLSEAIGNMRKDIRTTEVDIRMNSRVVKALFTFIKGLKASQLNSESGPAASGGSTLKRKRDEKEESGSEDEEKHVAARRKSLPKKMTVAAKVEPPPTPPPPPPPSVQPPSSHPMPPSEPHSNNLPPPSQYPHPPLQSRYDSRDRLAAIKAAREAHTTLPPLSLPSRPPPPSEPASLRFQDNRTVPHDLAHNIMARMHPFVSNAPYPSSHSPSQPYPTPISFRNSPHGVPLPQGHVPSYPEHGRRQSFTDDYHPPPPSYSAEYPRPYEPPYGPRRTVLEYGQGYEGPPPTASPPTAEWDAYGRRR